MAFTKNLARGVDQLVKDYGCTIQFSSQGAGFRCMVETYGPDDPFVGVDHGSSPMRALHAALLDLQDEMSRVDEEEMSPAEEDLWHDLLSGRL